MPGEVTTTAASDRYWWTYYGEPVGAFVIETWRGEPTAENVVAVGRAASLEDAESLVKELNRAE